MEMLDFIRVGGMFAFSTAYLILVGQYLQGPTLENLELRLMTTVLNQAENVVDDASSVSINSCSVQRNDEIVNDSLDDSSTSLSSLMQWVLDWTI